MDRDAQISVVVNNTDDEDTIDLGRVFDNAKAKGRIYIWVLLLCVALGVSAMLLAYQFTKPPVTVSSVVTLKYEVPDPDHAGQRIAVKDLTAPDGEALDLNQITSSYVLQSALEGLELSHPVTLANLRANIRIDKILTEDSRRQQEVAASMIEDKNNAAYTQVQGIQLTYDNRFVVSLTNGFGDEDARIKYELKDEELRLILDRMLSAYNDYLVDTYADIKLPDDEISVIDTYNLDILESLDLLREAVDNLDAYCAEKPEAVKAYRSWRTGRSLNDLTAELERVKQVNVDYLYSYVYTNSIVRNRDAMIVNYQFQLRNAQTELDVVNENIATTQSILDNYKNDEIFVSMQESDTAKSTQTTTDYYNALVLQQSENYAKAAELKVQITDLTSKLDSLNVISENIASEQAEEELANAVRVCQEAYREIKAHMEEVTQSPFYTTYAERSAAQGKSESFLKAAMKKIIIGAVAGAVIACGLWFLSALAPEFRADKDDGETEKKRKKTEEGEAAEA